MTTIHEAIDNFVQAKRVEGISEVTIRWYKQHLVKFAAWLPTDRAGLASIRSTDVSGFLANERDRGMAYNTVRGGYRTLDAFFNWCADALDQPSPMKRPDGRKAVKLAKAPKREPRRARVADVRCIIDSIGQETWLELRDRAILQLMLDTGIRVSECSGLRVADANIQERWLFIKAGKGDKDRRVPFSSATALALSLYLMSRPAWKGKELWLAASGQGNLRGALSNTGITLMIKRHCARLGINVINPHSIRHAFATKAINDGIRVEIVSKLLGHASLSFTLSVYATLLSQTQQDEYDAKWSTGAEVNHGT